MAPPSDHHVVKSLHAVASSLELAEQQPVIGRSDRTEDGQILTDHVGPTSILADDHPWVASWTSPVAHAYYDPESYLAKPGRSIELLRAHISDGGKLLGLHDLLDVRPRDATPPGSTVEEHLGVAEDAVKSAAEGRYRAAQAATSDRTGEELRSFVAPITPEQHRIIAAASEGHMVIAGPAGSGKSSVAFHRLAYHAAPDRGEKRLDMSDVLVRSPSDTYRNYEPHWVS